MTPREQEIRAGLNRLLTGPRSPELAEATEMARDLLVIIDAEREAREDKCDRCDTGDGRCCP